MKNSGVQPDTERLLLRPPAGGDLADYEALFLRPEVGAWLRPEPLPFFTAPEAGEMLAEDVRLWREIGFGPWALVEKAGGSFVGRAGLRRTAIENQSAIELVWTVDPDRQGHGFATEAAGAAIELARGQELGEVLALTLPGNAASRKVAEKAGLGLDGEVEHAGLPHLLYRLTLA